MPPINDPEFDELIVNCRTEATVDVLLRGETEWLRYSTGRDLTTARGSYKKLVRKTGALKLFEDAEANQMNVELWNIDNLWGEKVVSALRPLESARVSVRRYYQSADDPLVYRHEPFFGGILVRPEANEEFVNFDVILKTTAAGTALATKTLSPRDFGKVPGTVSQSPPGSPGNPTTGGGTIGGGSCFLAGTRILTARGWRKIEKIKKGWQVYSFDERTREIRADTVLETFRHFVSGYVNLRFDDGGILKVTPEHRFLTDSGEWKAACDLRYGSAGSRVWRFDEKRRRWTKSRLAGAGLARRAVYEVFNFHVAVNQNYIAEGFAAHNAKKEPLDPDYPPLEYPRYL